VLCQECADQQAKEKPVEVPQSEWTEKPTRGGRGWGMWLAVVLVLVVAGVAVAWWRYGPSRPVLGKQGKTLHALDLLPQDTDMVVLVEAARVRKEAPEGERLVKLAVDSAPTEWRGAAQSLSALKQVAVSVRMTVKPAPKGSSSRPGREPVGVPGAEAVLVGEAESSGAAKKALAALTRGMGSAQPKRERYEGVEILKWSNPQMAAARLDQFLLIGSRAEDLSAIVGAATSKAQQNGLSKSAAYVEAQKSLGMKPMVIVFERPEQFTVPLRVIAQAEGGSVGPEGMSEWAMMGADFDDKGVFFRAVQKMGPKGKTMMASLPASPVKLSVARWMPKNALIAFAGSNFGRWAKMMMDLMEESNPQIASAVLTMQQQLGFDLRRDLFPALVGDWALVMELTGTPPAMGTPRIALVVETAPGAGPAAYDRLVGAFKTAAPPTVAEQPGQKRAVIKLAVGPGMGAGLQLGVEATQNLVAIGMEPGFVNALMKGLPPEKSLAGLWKDKKIPEKAEALFYFNAASIAPMIGVFAGAVSGRQADAARVAASVLGCLGPAYGWSVRPSQTEMEFEGRMALDYKKLASTAEAAAKQSAGAKAKP
jgi:hypothetical protein